MEGTKLLYSPAEAASMLSLGRTKLFEEMVSGRLESYTIGRRRVIPRDSLFAYVAQLREEQSVKV